jgi:hypothetical protein
VSVTVCSITRGPDLEFPDRRVWWDDARRCRSVMCCEGEMTVRQGRRWWVRSSIVAQATCAGLQATRGQTAGRYRRGSSGVAGPYGPRGVRSQDKGSKDWGSAGARVVDHSARVEQWRPSSCIVPRCSRAWRCNDSWPSGTQLRHRNPPSTRATLDRYGHGPLLSAKTRGHDAGQCGRACRAPLPDQGWRDGLNFCWQSVSRRS